MSIDKKTALKRFREDCEREYNDAWVRGDSATAEMIKDLYYKREKEFNMGVEDLGTSLGLGNALNTSVGIGGHYGSMLQSQDYQKMQHQIAQQLAQAAQTAAPRPDKEHEPGTFYMNGAELPADWAGAKVDGYERAVAGSGGPNPRWQYVFKSKWSKDTIMVQFDANELSGKEANKLADTYMEVLNQRRAG